MLRRYAVLFAALTVIAGGLYWASTDEADWWAYVEEGPPRGRWPKFKLYWPEQMVVSAVVGAAIAAPMTLVAFVARRMWSRRTKRYL